MMKTGVVVRKKRWIGGKEGYEVEEFEIDTGAIEALNSIEKRAAIETGQEVDRSDISLRGGLAAQAEMLRKAFTLEELEIMDAKMEAALNGSPKLIDSPVALADEKKQEKPTSSSSENLRGHATLVDCNSSLGGEEHVDGNSQVNGKESWRS
jgi:hypothetical protein